jgi:hypothetical protein
MFSRAARGGLVALLAKDHIFGCEPAYLDKQLSGSAALRAAVKQAAVWPCATIWHAGRRAEVLFAPVFARAPVFPFATFVRGRVESLVVFHLCLHWSMFCPAKLRCDS